MPSLNPPEYGYAYEFYVGLVSQSNTKTLQSNPTLATGDVKVSKDGGAPANLGTLPTVVSSGKSVKVVLSASEMSADNVTVIFSDAAGAEWCDLVVNIPTVRALMQKGTAQGGAAGYIDLETSASSSDGFYANALVHIYEGTGAGQSRIISTYTGSSRRAAVDGNWTTNPDSTSKYKVYPSSARSTTAPTAAEIRAEMDSNSTKLDALAKGAPALLTTTIATLSSQTSFTLTAGSADNNAYLGSKIVITDQVTAEQKATGYISAYTGASKTVTLLEDPGIFTMAAGDLVAIFPPALEFFKRVVDGSTTMEKSVRLQNAAMAGKLSGAGTTSIAIRDLADSKDRITATVDANGNRSGVTLDLT